MKKMIIASCLVAVILAGCAAVGTTTNSNTNTTNTSKNVLSMEEAKTKALDFINNNLLQAGTKAEFKSITEENGLYKLVIDVGDSKGIESYITKDGTKFIPSMMDIKEVEAKNNQSKQQAQEAQKDVPKNDKPEVELFVMSYCPYGTQIEKGILPVVEALGDKIDFKLKFCDYAMHGEKELNEEVRQYCIMKNEPNKFNDYLKCFLDNADFEGCITKTGINNSTLQSCISSSDAEYKVTENFKNKDTWKGNYPPFDIYKGDNTKYGIQGSPSLIINGVKSSAQRDSASLLKAVCSAFNTAPEECSSELSSTPPAPGFGFEGSGSASSGSCN